MYMSVCKSAESEGVAVIHGSRGFFHSEKQPAFQSVYHAFDEVCVQVKCTHNNFKIIIYICLF